MITIRFVCWEEAGCLAQHRGRLGLAPLPGEQVLRALVTGAPPGTADAFPSGEGLPKAWPGDPERAPGTLLLTGRRADFERLCVEVADRQTLVELREALQVALVRVGVAPPATRIGPRLFEWGSRTFLMGVVNVTPDSFSDGGRHASADTAVAAGERLAAEGADLIDIGGESTRPGADPVGAEQELERVLPVLERLSRLVEVPLSVDTTKARVAEAALSAGASLINDVSGFRFDPRMAETVARAGAAACVMHMQGVPRSMQAAPHYLDVLGEVMESLKASLDLAVRCGVHEERLLVDPGLGFGKQPGHNLFLLRHLGQLRALGRPILVGASRKSFIGKVTGRAVGERLPGSLAILAAAVLAGADVVRVHDVAESSVAARMIDAVRRADEGGLAYQTPA